MRYGEKKRAVIQSKRELAWYPASLMFFRGN